MRRKSWDDDEEQKRTPCLALFSVSLVTFICLNVIGSVLNIISCQYAPSVVCFCAILLSISTLIGTLKKNYSIIAAFLFIQPIILASYIFLLLLYLQLIFELPFNTNQVQPEPVYEASGDESSGDNINTDDEDLSKPESQMLNTIPDQTYDFQGYLTLYLAPRYCQTRYSYLLSHPKLQAELITANMEIRFIETLTVGRLLEVCQFALLIIVGTICLIASISSHCYLRKRDENSWITKYDDVKFSYQSHRGNYGSDPPRYDPRSTDQLLKHQNSADKILSSHHSVTDNTYSSRNGYASNRYGYD